MLTIFACYVLTYIWDAASLFNHLPMMFLSTDCFSNKGLNKLPWTSYFHVMLGIVGRGVSGLTIDSHCGVWGRGWTTCLLHDSPLLGSHFEMRVDVWVWNEISYIYYCFLPRFAVLCVGLVFFNYMITKYFVHSYTVDVVFTVSYYIYIYIDGALPDILI